MRRLKLVIALLVPFSCCRFVKKEEFAKELCIDTYFAKHLQNNHNILLLLHSRNNIDYHIATFRSLFSGRKCMELKLKPLSNFESLIDYFSKLFIELKSSSLRQTRRLYYYMRLTSLIGTAITPSWFKNDMLHGEEKLYRGLGEIALLNIILSSNRICYNNITYVPLAIEVNSDSSVKFIGETSVSKAYSKIYSQDEGVRKAFNNILRKNIP